MGLAFMLTAALTPMAATSGTIPSDGIYRIQQVTDNRYLDAHENSDNDYRLVTRPYQDNSSQLWKLDALDNHAGMFQMVNGRFMDAHESSNDYRAVTRGHQANDSQRWIMIGNGGDNGVYQIAQRSSKRYLSAYPSDAGSNAYNVVTRPHLRNDSQKWKLTKIQFNYKLGDKGPAGGTVCIVNKEGTSGWECLDPTEIKRQYTWQDAKSVASSRQWPLGPTDGRLPTIDQLERLFDVNNTRAIYRKRRWDEGTIFWSSDTRVFPSKPLKKGCEPGQCVEVWVGMYDYPARPARKAGFGGNPPAREAREAGTQVGTRRYTRLRYLGGDRNGHVLVIRKFEL